MSDDGSWGQPPLPPSQADSREEHWMHFDSSVNAISFGFVATAILISMFLVMAIFERFLRQRSQQQQQQQPAGVRGLGDPDGPPAHAFLCKLEASPPTVQDHPSGDLVCILYESKTCGGSSGQPYLLPQYVRVCKRCISVNAWPADPNLHCPSCADTLQPGACTMAAPS